LRHGWIITGGCVMTKINWRRKSYQLHARRSGSVSIIDEAEHLDRDAASRWLARHQSRRPRARPTITVSSSSAPPWNE
jgi:hypothetical protein